MPDLATVLDGNREAAEQFIAAAEQSASEWNTPRSPGKWTPSQLTEHVALTLEEGAKLVAGTPSAFPTLPAFVRPLLRILFFNRVIRRGVFPNAKTMKGLDPLVGPATPAEARGRVEGALAAFESACRGRAASGRKVDHGAFGGVTVADYAEFMRLHTRHHREQL